MVRTFTLVVLLSSLVAGSWLMSTTYRHLGTHADRESGTGPLALEKAAEALEDWRAEARTYEGAALKAFPGVGLVRADARSYCLELAYEGDAYHREGPNGAATRGRCPRR